MKRTALCLLTLVLCLVCSCALALEDAVIDHSDLYFAMDLEAVGDTLYTLAEKDGAYYIARWETGYDQPVLSGEPINYALNMYLSEAQPADDGSRIVTMLFTDGKRLMSLDPVLGVVFGIDFSDSRLTYTDIAQVEHARSLYFDDLGYTRSLVNAAAVGDTVYWLTAQWDENGTRRSCLDAISLKTGEVTPVPVERVDDFAVMPDGKLVLLIGDQTASGAAPSLAMYDPATTTVAPKGGLWSQSVGHISYDNAHGTVVYLEGSRVMGVRNFMETLQYGYVPVEAVAMTVADGHAAVSSGSVTVIRQLEPGYQPACELTVLNGSYANPDAAAQYGYMHPDAAIYWFDNYSDMFMSDHSYEALVGLVKENQMDAGIVTVSVSGFEQMMKNGYCADLSVYPGLAESVGRMYPPFREAVTSGGSLYGIPLTANSWSWGYDPSTLEAVGLSPEDLPTNLIDLCSFITRWNDDLMDRYPDVALFAYVDDTRGFVLGAMISQYAAWSEATYGMLTFDTPEFRALLAAAEGMSCARIDARAREGAVTRSLLFNDLPCVGYFEWSRSAGDGYAAYLPMSIAQGVQPVEQVYLEVAFIPAGCADADEAAALIAYLLDHSDPAVKATLFMDANEPVRNEDYPALEASSKAYLTELYAKRDASADGDREQYEALIVEQEAFIRNVLPGFAWRVSADDLAFYQQTLAPNMHVMRCSCVTDWTGEAYEACYDLLQRYAYGDLTEDQLIAELVLLQ